MCVCVFIYRGLAYPQIVPAFWYDSAYPKCQICKELNAWMLGPGWCGFQYRVCVTHWVTKQVTWSLWVKTFIIISITFSFMEGKFSLCFLLDHPIIYPTQAPYYKLFTKMLASYYAWLSAKALPFLETVSVRSCKWSCSSLRVTYWLVFFVFLFLWVLEDSTYSGIVRCLLCLLCWRLSGKSTREGNLVDGFPIFLLTFPWRWL